MGDVTFEITSICGVKGLDAKLLQGYVLRVAESRYDTEEAQGLIAHPYNAPCTRLNGRKRIRRKVKMNDPHLSSG
jgi:hypothetical protein